MSQFAQQHRDRFDDEMKCHAPIALHQSIDDRSGNGRHWRSSADADLTHRRIREMLNLGNALSELVERDDAALEQSAAVRVGVTPCELRSRAVRQGHAPCRRLHRIRPSAGRPLAIAASHCRCRLWVTSCRSATLDKTATLLPLYPQQRTSPRTSRRMALCAKNGPKHVRQQLWTECRYSITSSATASKLGGSVKPSALAVFRLTTVS